MILSAEDLLAGTDTSFEIAIPDSVFQPNGLQNGQMPSVKVKPLSIGVFQLIIKGAKEDAGLIPVLMIKEGMAEPKLTVQQIKALPVGLVEFLVEQIRNVSGLSEKKTT